MGKSQGFRVSASVRGGDTSKYFEDFYLEVKARIWPRLSCVCSLMCESALTVLVDRLKRESGLDCLS